MGTPMAMATRRVPSLLICSRLLAWLAAHSAVRAKPRPSCLTVFENFICRLVCCWVNEEAVWCGYSPVHTKSRSSRVLVSVRFSGQPASQTRPACMKLILSTHRRAQATYSEELLIGIDGVS